MSILFSFLVSLSLLCAIVQGADQCKTVSTTDVSGFSTFYSRPDDANAYIQDLRPLVSASRAEAGNRGYHMYINENEPGVIGFMESYVDNSAFTSHLNSKHVTSIFDHQYYKEIKSRDPQLFGPWTEVSPDAPKDEEIEMVFYWTMMCEKKHIWDIITNWTDASWVQGDPKTTIVPLDDDGNVASDEEAKKIGYVDPEGGLGPVVQRRTWASGNYVDVRMLSKDEKTFTTVQQTLSSLAFPKVTFDKFYVTLSLDSEGLDPDLESRMRYHVRATVKNGTADEARNTLKSDFYGPRIAFYKEYFNCTQPVFTKRAEDAVTNLYKAMEEQSPEERLKAIKPLFLDGGDADKYVKRALDEDASDSDVSVSVHTAFPVFATPDLRVVAVEDIIVKSQMNTYVKSRIVIYQADKWGRLLHTRIFDKRADEAKTSLAKKLVHRMDRYFKTLESGKIEKVRRLYVKKPVIYDPVSFQPARSFDSVYTNFYTLATSYEYVRTPDRVFVDVENRQVAQLIDASFELASGDDLISFPVQVFTFNKNMKITSFEAFFKPTVIDFAALE